jgi:hypothetical protein
MVDAAIFGEAPLRSLPLKPERVANAPRLYYRCPGCLGLDRLKFEEYRATCPDCGYSATIQEDFSLVSGDWRLPLPSYKKEILAAPYPPGFHHSAHTEVFREKPDGMNWDTIGPGTIEIEGKRFRVTSGDFRLEDEAVALQDNAVELLRFLHIYDGKDVYRMVFHQGSAIMWSHLLSLAAGRDI